MQGGNIISIGRVVVVVVNMKKYLETEAPEQLISILNQLNFGEKLASVCSKSRDMTHEHQKQCLFVSHYSHTYG